MKKLIYLIIPAILAAMIFGCGEKAEEPVKAVSFKAEVLETDPLLVKPDDGSAELSSADKIYIDTSKMTDEQSALTLRAMRVGDTVRIEYDGMIAETYPAQISGESIVFCDKNDNDMTIGWRRAAVIESEYTRPGRPVVWLDGDDESDTVYLLQSDYSNDPEVEAALSSLETGDTVYVCFCVIFESNPPVIDVYRVLTAEDAFSEDV